MEDLLYTNKFISDDNPVKVTHDVIPTKIQLDEQKGKIDKPILDDTLND